MFDLATVTAEDFQPLIDESFRVSDDEQHFDFQLIEVTTHKAEENMTRVPFSLLFLGPQGIRFEQGCLPLTHPTFGEHSMFMVPVDERDGALLYESVFN